MAKDAVIILSGGMDSCTMLHEYKDEIALAITFDYGSTQNHREQQYAIKQCQALGVKHLIIPLDFIHRYFKSIVGDRKAEGHVDRIYGAEGVTGMRWTDGIQNYMTAKESVTELKRAARGLTGDGNTEPDNMGYSHFHDGDQHFATEIAGGRIAVKKCSFEPEFCCAFGRFGFFGIAGFEFSHICGQFCHCRTCKSARNT